MTIIGVTGHQAIPEAALSYIIDGVRSFIREVEPPLRAVTSLAAGADQTVALEVIHAGGSVDVIVPCRNYESTFNTVRARQLFRSLMSRAESVTTLDFSRPSEAAFLEAGKRIVEGSDVLLAVWDGLPARGLGGTADVVAYADKHGKKVRVIWPAGVFR